MKEKLRAYFSFSKSTNQGIILLSILCGLSIAYYCSLDLWISAPHITKAHNEELDSLLSSIYIDTSYKTVHHNQKLTPFTFNPNTLNEAGFIKIGLRPKLIQTILNYRKKGGTFYKKTDFKKIWGLREETYRQLAPFIRIPKKRLSSKDYAKKESERKLHIEINGAGLKELILLKGVAQKRANQILAYRKTLGGFYSVSQLKEVYGIPIDLFHKIAPHLYCNSDLIKQININVATLKEMNQHPYLQKDNWGLKITRFRKSQDYDIKALEDLKKMDGMTNEIYLKIVPYLSLQ